VIDQDHDEADDRALARDVARLRRLGRHRPRWAASLEAGLRHLEAELDRLPEQPDAPAAETCGSLRQE
jgi:hypothetical protein